MVSVYEITTVFLSLLFRNPECSFLHLVLFKVLFICYLFNIFYLFHKCISIVIFGEWWEGVGEAGREGRVRPL